MDKPQNLYRIKEHLGNFTIEIQVEEVSGILWWTQRKTVWKRANAHGYYHDSVYVQRIISVQPPFDSLEKALQKIKDWNTAPIYHYENYKRIDL